MSETNELETLRHEMEVFEDLFPGDGGNLFDRMVAVKEIADSAQTSKVCHVCQQATPFACSDCRIDFGVTIHVCAKKACRTAHEEKCSARLREKLEAIANTVFEGFEKHYPFSQQADRTAYDGLGVYFPTEVDPVVAALIKARDAWKLLAEKAVGAPMPPRPEFVPRPPRRPLRDGEPCEHTGCLRHLSHPCEGCGRIGGRRTLTQLMRDVKAVFCNGVWEDWTGEEAQVVCVTTVIGKGKSMYGAWRSAANMILAMAEMQGEVPAQDFFYQYLKQHPEIVKVED